MEFFFGALALALITGGTVFLGLFLGHLAATQANKRDVDVRNAIRAAAEITRNYPSDPKVTEDELLGDLTIISSPFICVYPLTDKSFRPLMQRNFVKVDMRCGLCEARLSTTIKAESGDVSHQINYTTRSKMVSEFPHRSADIDDDRRLGSIYSGFSVNGSERTELWKVGGRIISAYLYDHVIDIKDGIIRSFDSDVRFRVRTPHNSTVKVELPFAHIRAQLQKVDQLLERQNVD